MMSWFKREKTPLRPPEEGERNVRTEGLFEKCPGCQRVVWKKDLERNHSVCTKCGHHSKITARQRLDLLFDNQQWVEFDQGLRTSDPLEFRDRKSYKARLEQAYRVTGHTEAVINAEGRMGGYRLICSCMEYRFIGGSMGSVVGEKITRAIERALQTRQALVICSASGGARMMEGFLSLMQMAKISSTLARLDSAGLPYISLLTDPTTGGVTASFAMLGDINIAEPGALIGFAGPRVIEQTIRQKLPEGFQSSEFLLEHGMLDAIVERKDLKNYMTDWLEFMSYELDPPDSRMQAKAQGG